MWSGCIAAESVSCHRQKLQIVKLDSHITAFAWLNRNVGLFVQFETEAKYAFSENARASLIAVTRHDNEFPLMLD